MKKFLVFPLALILLSQYSCKRTLLSLAGFREPKVETKQSVYKYLKDLGQDTSDVFALDTSLLNHFKKVSYKPGTAKGFRPVQIRVYGSDMKPVMQWASCEGFLNNLKLFDSVPPKNIHSLDTINLQEDLSRYFTLDGYPGGIIAKPGWDFYILVYFAKYFPRLSRQSFKTINSYKASHPELKIKIYKINVDIQKLWNVDFEIETEVSIGRMKEPENVHK
jgi:hypothetical protein